MISPQCLPGTTIYPGVPRQGTWPMAKRSGTPSTMQSAFQAYSIRLAVPRTPPLQSRRQSVVKLQRSLARQHRRQQQQTQSQPQVDYERRLSERQKIMRPHAPLRKRHSTPKLDVMRPSSADAASVDKGSCVAWQSAKTVVQPQKQETGSARLAIEPKQRRSNFGLTRASTPKARRITKITPLQEQSAAFAKSALAVNSPLNRPSAVDIDVSSVPASSPTRRRQLLHMSPKNSKVSQRTRTPSSDRDNNSYSEDDRQSYHSSGSNLSACEKEEQRKKIQIQIRRARLRVQEEKARIAEAERTTRVEAERVREAARSIMHERQRSKEYTRRYIYAKNKLMREFFEAQNPATAIPVAP